MGDMGHISTDSRPAIFMESSIACRRSSSSSSVPFPASSLLDRIDRGASTATEDGGADGSVSGSSVMRGLYTTPSRVRALVPVSLSIPRFISLEPLTPPLPPSTSFDRSEADEPM